MAVVIRMKRIGGKRRPFFRLVVTDSRGSRDGKCIEELGNYDPKGVSDEEKVTLKSDRIKYWLEKGAQPSETVKSILKKQGLLVAK